MPVTLTLEQLADHLRLDRAAATSTDERYTVLFSLFESGKAEVDRYAPDAPTAVQNEALALLAGYRYDAPPGGRGGSPANAFQNSGAQALLAAYHSIATAKVGDGSPQTASQGGDGLDEEAVEALIQAALAAYAPGGGSPLFQAQLWVTNAQLKTLDTNYRQIIAAPGAGKFIQVRQLWIQKHGSDQPPEHTEYYRVAISPNPVITEAEALAGSGRGDTFGEIPVQDWDTPHYFYAGTSLTNQDVTSLDGLTDFAATFERVPGSIEVDGLAFKWWRTRQTYASRAELFLHGRATTRVRRDTSAPTTERIGRNMRFALLFEDDSPAGPYPLANEDQTIVSGYTYDSLLAAPASAIFAYAIGGQVLFEHQALMLGGAFDLLEQWRSAYFSTTAHDAYLGTVNDVAFGITVRYEIHDATTPPPGP